MKIELPSFMRPAMPPRISVVTLRMPMSPISTVATDDVVFVNSRDELFAHVHRHRGYPLETALPTEQFASPALADGIDYLGSTNGRLYAFSVNGGAVPARLADGALGVRPALPDLKPDRSLKAVKQQVSCNDTGRCRTEPPP